jgi:PIN domain nuclease of toxin-antitoxin system
VLILGHLGVLPAKVQQMLAPIEVEILMSSASLMEIATKNAIGKLRMSEDEVEFALQDLRIDVLPFDASHGLEMFTLPMHHRDPFDRMILATAMAEKLPVVTGDPVFRRYAGVKIIW